jgi:3-phenylpropionate/cinnamic acid dioxygenase small subunit
MTAADALAFAATSPTTRRRLSKEDMYLHFEVEQFLAYEGHLLDDRRFHEWFDLLADDLEYWMPVRSNRARGDEANEIAALGEGAFFDETKELIQKRIAKLDTGYTWAEDPPSRTRHMFTNLRVIENNGSEVKTSCNFFVYRSRLAFDEDFWIGRREDTLRRTPQDWQIVKRHLFLDQVSLLSKNLSIFF